VLTPSTLSEILQRLNGRCLRSSTFSSTSAVFVPGSTQRTPPKVLTLSQTVDQCRPLLHGLEEALIDHGVRLLVVDSMAALAGPQRIRRVCMVTWYSMSKQ
jgi:hypothetical protein